MPTGKVKWYDVEKGFGFATSDDGDDVFVHSSTLPEGVVALKPGSRIEFGVVDGKRGARAVRDEVAKCVTDPLAGLLLTGQAGQCVAIQIQENSVQLLVSDGETMLSGA